MDLTYQDLQPLKEVCQGLEEHAYYIVFASLPTWRYSYMEYLPVHKTILYTGFKGGGYRKLLCGDYEQGSENPHFETRIKVISKIENI